MHQLEDNNLEKFSFWVPVEFEKGKKGVREQEMRIKGVASYLSEDSDGETLDPAGFDWTPLLTRGFLNWDHQAKQRASAIVGEVDYADLRDNNKAFYIEGFLYPDSDDARDVWKLALVLDKNSKTRRLGFSIEGSIVERGCGPQFLDKEKTILNPDYSIQKWNKIVKARIIHVAITPMPKNPNTLLQVMKGEAVTPLMVCDGFDCEIKKAWEEVVELEKGGPGSGRHKKAISSFKNEDEEDDAYQKIRDEIRDDYDDPEEEDEDDMNREADRIFAERHGYERGSKDFDKAISAEGMSSDGLIAEHIEGTRNPNKIPLEDCDHDYKDGKCTKCGHVAKVVNKSEVYNLIAEKYTTNPLIAKEIFSLIKSINAKQFNMQTEKVTLESVNKAFQFLEKGIEATALEAGNTGSDLSKGENAAEAGADKKVGEEDKDNLEKAVEFLKGMDGNAKMSKEEMKECLVKGGYSEATADSAAQVIADANAGDKNGGEIKEENAPIVKSETGDQLAATLKEGVDFEGLIKGMTTQLIGHSDKKFQAVGLLLRSQAEQIDLQKSQLEELTGKVEAFGKVPQPRKSATTAQAVQRFEKSEANASGAIKNGVDVYDLNKAEDRSDLTDRLFNKAMEFRNSERGPNTLLEKAIADLELSKSMSRDIQPLLKSMNIATIPFGQKVNFEIEE